MNEYYKISNRNLGEKPLFILLFHRNFENCVEVLSIHYSYTHNHYLRYCTHSFTSFVVYLIFASSTVYCLQLVFICLLLLLFLLFAIFVFKVYFETNFKDLKIVEVT